MKAWPDTGTPQYCSELLGVYRSCAHTLAGHSGVAGVGAGVADSESVPVVESDAEGRTVGESESDAAGITEDKGESESDVGGDGATVAFGVPVDVDATDALGATELEGVAVCARAPPALKSARRSALCMGAVSRVGGAAAAGAPPSVSVR